jgi:hypothetical protein
MVPGFSHEEVNREKANKDVILPHTSAPGLKTARTFAKPFAQLPHLIPHSSYGWALESPFYK